MSLNKKITAIFVLSFLVNSFIGQTHAGISCCKERKKPFAQKETAFFQRRNSYWQKCKELRQAISDDPEKDYYRYANARTMIKGRKPCPKFQPLENFYAHLYLKLERNSNQNNVRIIYLYSEAYRSHYLWSTIQKRTNNFTREPHENNTERLPINNVMLKLFEAALEESYLEKEWMSLQQEYITQMENNPNFRLDFDWHDNGKRIKPFETSVCKLRMVFNKNARLEEEASHQVNALRRYTEKMNRSSHNSRLNNRPPSLNPSYTPEPSAPTAVAQDANCTQQR
ncbi:hypothetical protein HOD08_02330 [bacterium]|nr:hypothetical protein [bacterium]